MNNWLLLPFRVAPPYLAQLSGTYSATKQGNFIVFLGWTFCFFLFRIEINNVNTLK